MSVRAPGACLHDDGGGGIETGVEFLHGEKVPAARGHDGHRASGPLPDWGHCPVERIDEQAGTAATLGSGQHVGSPGNPNG